MLDTRIRRLIDPVFNSVGRRLQQQGVTANQITWAGFVLALATFAAILQAWFWTALCLLLLSRACDALDGAVARAGEKTDLGGYLDIVLDFIFYGLVPLGFVLLDPAANGVAGSILLFAFYANGASFLAYGLIAEKRGLSAETRGAKSILYTVGLAEATETIVVFCAFCLFPQWFAPLAIAFALVCFVTTISRIVLAMKSFR